MLFFALFIFLSPSSGVPLVVSASNDTAPVSTATTEGRLAVFDDAWERINERYYDQTFHGLDWEAQRTTFRAQAAKAESPRELYAILRRMIGSLNDPHTRVFAPEEKFDWWHPKFVTTGLSIAQVNRLPTVVSVDPNSPAHRAGIKAGDVIETIDGQPATTDIQNALQSLPQPVSAGARFRVFAKLLDGPPDTTVDLTWITKAGQRKSSKLVRYWQQRELGVRLTRQRDSIAVIDIEAFTRPIAVAFDRTIGPQLKGVRGVVIDLRANGGGDAEAMSEIASAFLGSGTNLGLFTDRVGSSFSLSTQVRSLLSIDFSQATRVPLIVLTSERTASAAEIFVAALQSSHRAVVVGHETCGCVLAVRSRHVLPDGGLLDVSELDYATADGHRLEGHGLQPDEPVGIQREDLYAGRDRVLRAAIDAIAHKSDSKFQIANSR